jgi:hypothetical protein
VWIFFNAPSARAQFACCAVSTPIERTRLEKRRLMREKKLND